MELIGVDQGLKCYHCGDECDISHIQFDSKNFCCRGCKSVYEILSGSNLIDYYQLGENPGLRLTAFNDHKYAFLDNPEIGDKLIDFSSENLVKVNLYIPGIHCSSCIWLLENLSRLNPGVLMTRANLAERRLAVDFDPSKLTLRGLVELLSSIGYEPIISLERERQQKDQTYARNQILKIAVAGFCFGNIMLLSFPEYLGFDAENDRLLSDWFSWIMVLLSIPVLVFCATGYFKSAYNGLKQRYLNIDVPIALGIIALAGRSYYEIIFDLGSGYLDSLAGLLFLLLIGQWFQQRTYSTMSFNRDFRSYFPLAVTKLVDGQEQQVLIEDLKQNDDILLRNEELIPADSILLDEATSIDYSFVNGESKVTTRKVGEQIFAGGRHLGGITKYRVQKPVSQSYLTQLWNHQSFSKSKLDPRELLINGISKYFTLVVLVLATGSAAFWWYTDPSKALFVFTSVLIVACPCALAMATPFTLGTVLNFLGRNKLYLKNAQVVDKMATINTVVFDKTGTLTELLGSLEFEGSLNKEQAKMIVSLAQQSNHPISRAIASQLKRQYSLNGSYNEVNNFKEIPGKGISGVLGNERVAIGNADFLGLSDDPDLDQTMVSIDDCLVGSFRHNLNFRMGLKSTIRKMAKTFTLFLLSGDNDSQEGQIKKQHPWFNKLLFKQSPFAKLDFIEEQQSEGKNVMMLGDGLNDAGALQKSDVGLAVTENPQFFTPASDGIIHASALVKLPEFMKLAGQAQVIIILGFIFSFIYNTIGLSFAVTGNLTPIVAAVLMPVSSISVVVFSTVCVRLAAHKLKLN